MLSTLFWLRRWRCPLVWVEEMASISRPTPRHQRVLIVSLLLLATDVMTACTLRGEWDTPDCPTTDSSNRSLDVIVLSWRADRTDRSAAMKSTATRADRLIEFQMDRPDVTRRVWRSTLISSFIVSLSISARMLLVRTVIRSGLIILSKKFTPFRPKGQWQLTHLSCKCFFNRRLEELWMLMTGLAIWTKRISWPRPTFVAYISLTTVSEQVPWRTRRTCARAP